MASVSKRTSKSLEASEKPGILFTPGHFIHKIPPRGTAHQSVGICGREGQACTPPRALISSLLDSDCAFVN